MNKRQTVWLIVRLIGVYFAYWAIVAFLSLIGAIYAYVSLPSGTSTTKANTGNTRVQMPTPTINPAIQTVKTPAEEEAEKLKSGVGKDILWQLFLTAIYGASGWYLIKNGKHLFAVLNREELTDETDETASFPLPKSKENAVATPDISSRKEEVTSLNLSEYIPKSKQIAPSDSKDEEPAAAEVSSEQLQSEVSSSTDEQKSMEQPKTTEIETPVNEPILADEETTRMDYALPTLEEKPSNE